jgi:hypothetical protein
MVTVLGQSRVPLGIIPILAEGTVRIRSLSFSLGIRIRQGVFSSSSMGVHKFFQKTGNLLKLIGAR